MLAPSSSSHRTHFSSFSDTIVQLRRAAGCASVEDEHTAHSLGGEAGYDQTDFSLCVGALATAAGAPPAGAKPRADTAA